MAWMDPAVYRRSRGRRRLRSWRERTRPLGRRYLIMVALLLCCNTRPGASSQTASSATLMMVGSIIYETTWEDSPRLLTSCPQNGHMTPGSRVPWCPHRRALPRVSTRVQPRPGGSIAPALSRPLEHPPWCCLSLSFLSSDDVA